jgi:hypothetical protein
MGATGGCVALLRGRPSAVKGLRRFATTYGGP